MYFTFNQLLNKQSQRKPQALGVASSKLTPLGKVVQDALKGSSGKYSVLVKNLKTDESYAFNEHSRYEAGSLYKLWIMAITYQRIQQGKIKETEVLSGDVSDLNNEFDIDSKSAELTEGTVTLPVNSALNQMITISHNYAALLLTRKIGISSISPFLKTNGFNDSAVGLNGKLPKTSAFDTALFFEKLYKGQLANKQFTEEMLDLLKGQQLNEKLPKYLPDDLLVAHKTGEIDKDTHDGGIVYTTKGDYIIVILSESSSPDGANDRIAQVSKAVYTYFANGR